MLAVAEGKLSRCDLPVRQKVKLIQADMRSFDLAGKGFDFAFIAFSTFLHLLTHEDQLNCLRRIAGHLRPGGGLTICVFQPDFRRPEGVLKLGHAIKIPEAGLELIRYHQQSNDYARQLIDVSYIYQIQDKGTSHAFATGFQLRILLRGELELLLDKAGFDIRSVFGSFEKEPHDTASGSIITVAEKR
jgi:SAM-dependent methyltransferase